MRWAVPTLRDLGAGRAIATLAVRDGPDDGRGGRHRLGLRRCRIHRARLDPDRPRRRDLVSRRHTNRRPPASPGHPRLRHPDRSEQGPETVLQAHDGAKSSGTRAVIRPDGPPAIVAEVLRSLAVPDE